MFESCGECGLAENGKESSRAREVSCKEVEKALRVAHVAPAHSPSHLPKAVEAEGCSVLCVLFLTLPFTRGRGSRGLEAKSPISC